MTKKQFIEKYGEEAWKAHLEYNKQYKKQHREEIREQQQQYQQQYQKQYQKQYRREYYQKHRDEIRKHRLEYQRKNVNMFAYCIPEQIEQIENYELAKVDDFNGWDIHHRLETHNSDGEKRLVNLSRDELIALEVYYNRPASELIFLTKSEHRKLHCKVNIDR